MFRNGRTLCHEGFWVIEPRKNAFPKNSRYALLLGRVARCSSYYCNSGGNILQIIVFAMSMGFAVSFLEQEKQEFVLKFFNYMTELFIKVMTGIMYIAPIGVFCLMADATGSFG